MYNYLRQGLFFLFISVFLAACSQTADKQIASDNKYSLFIIDKTGNKFLIETNSLNAGIINPAKNNILHDIEGIHREMFVRNGYYYRLNPKTKEFTKYQNVNGKLTKVGAISLKEFYIENYSWLSNDTLFLFDAYIKNQQGGFNYVKINTSDMTFRSGILPIPLLKKEIAGASIGFTKMNGLGDWLIGYSFHIAEAEGYRTIDTTYIAVINYPSLQLKNIIKTTKSVYPGGENAVEPSTFTDEKGDFYFMTCPGVAMGNSPEKPTALFRIKKNEEQIDSTFFFDISASAIQNHSYSIYYLGNNKAIIRNERKDLFTKWDQHWKVPHFEFHLVDIQSKQIQKLNLPLDKGTRRQCILQEGDIIYISVNSEKEGNYIWNYNLKTGKLQKGLQLTGPTDYILRMDKLN